jgi:hypothetical protein
MVHNTVLNGIVLHALSTIASFSSKIEALEERVDKLEANSGPIV